MIFPQNLPQQLNGNDSCERKEYMPMNKLLFLFSVVLVLTAQAQQDTFTKERVDGRSYYVHIVQQGNTLWSMHETYDVPTDEIVKANPGIDKGLSLGQKIRIPVPRKTISYTIASKETLYAISKKFEVTMDAIVAANPGVENGVRAGQVLKIENVDRDLVEKVMIANPFSGNQVDTKDSLQTFEANQFKVDSSDIKKYNPIKIPLSDTVISYVVRTGETLYTISKRFMVSVEELQQLNQLKSTVVKPGDVIKIQVKKEQQKQPEIREIEPRSVAVIDSTLLFPKKKEYNIALLLPFSLDSENENDPVSERATQFYMGVKLALDSLKKIGFNADVFVYDVKNDSLKTKKLLSSADFKQIDLIIGPMFPECVSVVSRWCKTHRVRMICPTSVPASSLRANPFVYASVPTDIQLQEYLAAYLVSERKSDQIILVKPTGEKDLLAYEAFRRTFNAIPGHSKLFEAASDSYVPLIKKGVSAVVVFPSNDKGQIVNFMNSVNSTSSKIDAEKLLICGTKEWMGMDEVKAHFREKYHFHYASPNDLNYGNEFTKRLLRQFRSVYNTDLSKMSAQGFDVMFYACSVLLTGNEPGKLLMNDFLFEQKGSGDGYQNTKAFILMQRDYELKRIDW
jgi:LysM repeat protein